MANLYPVVGNVSDAFCANCTGKCYVDLCIIDPSPPPTSPALHPKSRLVPTILIAASAILAASFLLLIATYAVHRIRRRRRLRALSAASSGGWDNDDDDDDDVSEEGEVDHHIWNIRTVGLDEATIRSIVACVYDSKDGLLDDSGDCSVCLAQLRDGELLRLLPKCGHAFHLPCIDTWLRSHVNCPLCRAPILAPATAEPETAASSTLVVSVDPVDSDTASSDLMENTQITMELEGGQVVPEVEIGNGIDLASASSSSPPSSELPIGAVEDGLQPVRRSVSMDSSSLAALFLRVEPEEKPSEERKELETGEDLAVKNKGKQVNPGKVSALQKGTIGMGRSLSSRSGRLFLWRARNSVLPL